jgi:hypothetical protein
MKKTLALLLVVAFAGVVGAQQAVYPIYEIATQDLPDLFDNSLQDWEDVLPGTSLTQDDFAPLAVADGAGINTADLAYVVYMAWNSADQRIYFALQRVDDVYVNTYEGGAPQNMWMHDGFELMLDGDHTGGDYNGFSADVYGADQAKLLTGYQAQQYLGIPESPDGKILGNNTAASGWVSLPPWADGSGYSFGTAPTTYPRDLLDSVRPAGLARAGVQHAQHAGRQQGHRLPGLDHGLGLHGRRPAHDLPRLPHAVRPGQHLAHG